MTIKEMLGEIVYAIQNKNPSLGFDVEYRDHEDERQEEVFILKDKKKLFKVIVLDVQTDVQKDVQTKG